MLFIKECKKIFFSITFVLYVIGIFAMYSTQFISETDDIVTPPVKGLESYGTFVKEEPEILMPSAVRGLIREYLSGSYTAYPVGFYKNVRLSEKKSNEMSEIIYELSGITSKELDELKNSNSDIPDIAVSQGLTYEHFRELMKKADKLIGGGSDYSEQYIVERFSRVPKTYDDALAEYSAFINDDKITRAYARLFCDYVGIPISFLPIFISVAICLRDKKARMQSLVFSRKISSVKLIIIRYAAMIFILTMPVIITALAGTLFVNKLYPDFQTDTLAFFKYSLIWLVPNIMISTGVGMLITELTMSSAAILIYGMWWFISLFSSAGALVGRIGMFTMIIRHNSLLDSDIFMRNYNTFLLNRMFFTAASLLIVILTVIIYEQKRRGRLDGYSWGNKNHKNKSEA